MEPTNRATDAKLSFFENFMNRTLRNWIIDKGRKLLPKENEIVLSSLDIAFFTEIETLMYVFGDVREPELSSVVAMSKQLRIYINNLIADANNIAKMRRDDYLDYQSILFVLRKKKEKMQRLFDYLQIKDCERSLNKNYGYFKTSVVEEVGPCVRDCVQFLEKLFTPEEVFCLKNPKERDLLSQRRLQRTDIRSKLMSVDEYKEFTEKQQCSFTNDLGSFQNWIVKDQVFSFKPTTRSLEIINFLVRDYILEVIDEVLVNRKKVDEISPEIQALYNSRLPGWKNNPSYEKPSRISSIIRKYDVDSPQLLRNKNENAAILPHEIIFAANKLQAVSNPFPKLKRSLTAQQTSGINLDPSAATKSRTLITSDSSIPSKSSRSARMEDFDALISKAISKETKFSINAPTSSKLSDVIISPTPKTTSKTTTKKGKYNTIASNSSKSSDIISDFNSFASKTTSEPISKKVKLRSTNAPKSSIPAAKKGNAETPTSSRLRQRITRSKKY